MSSKRAGSVAGRIGSGVAVGRAWGGGQLFIQEGAEDRAARGQQGWGEEARERELP